MRRKIQNFGDYCFRILLLLLLGNLPFWLMGYSFFIDRALINLDYLLLVFVIPLGLVAQLFILLLLWIIDSVAIFSHVYQFKSIVDFAQSIRFIDLINTSDFVSLNVVIIILFVLWGRVVIRELPRIILCIPIFSISLFFLSVDYFNGSLGMVRGDTMQTSINVAGSSLRIFFLQISKLYSEGYQNFSPVLESDRLLSSNEIEKWPLKYQDRSVLFVIVESLGHHNNSEIMDWLRAQLIDPVVKDKYNINILLTSFRGATTDGELRQLCGISGSYSIISSQTKLTCIPQIFSDAGWVTSGFHGFSGRMFDRQNWWPFIGIQNTYFAENLLKDAAPKCGGAFRGACDINSLEPISKLLSVPKQFVYQLTLNTHLPFEFVNIPDDLKIICGRNLTGDLPCQLIAAHGIYFRALREILTRINLPPVVVLVGDHAPPFSKVLDRDLFDKKAVPAIILLPKIK